MPELRPRRGPRKRRSRSRSPGYGFHYETLDHLLSVAEQGPAIWVASWACANAAILVSAQRARVWLLRRLLLEARSTAQRLDGTAELVQRLDRRPIALGDGRFVGAEVADFHLRHLGQHQEVGGVAPGLQVAGGGDGGRPHQQ